MKLYVPFIAVGIYALVLLTLYVFRFGFGLPRQHETWGQFGDFLGGSINPVISIIAIVYAIESFRRQSSDSKRMQFESNLFELFSIRREIVSNLRFNQISGLAVIDKLIGDIAKAYLKTDRQQSSEERLKTLVKLYEAGYGTLQFELGSLLRNIFNIYLYIEHYTKDFEEQYYYMRFLRSQLSDFEIMLIGLNGLSQPGRVSKPFIEKYALLNNFGSAVKNVVSEWRDLLGEAYAPGAFTKSKSS